MPKLTSDDTAEFDIQSLPESFREAIILTRELGLKYLWIDSLCINQNDPEDWRVQSAQMQMVYEFSVVNFAATGSSESGGALYSSVDWQAGHMNYISFGIECSWNTCGASTSRLCYLMTKRLDLQYCLEESELNKRGWVLQERLLSPRTIHFDKKTIYWECRESYSLAFISNDGLYDLDLCSIDQHQNAKIWIEETRNAMSSFAEGRGSLAQAYRTWTLIRDIYSRTVVTYESDKLVALSSVAAVLGRLLLDKYVGGVWKRTALYDLLWFAYTPGKRSDHGAPSWSWASMMGGALMWPPDILPRYPHDSYELA